MAEAKSVVEHLNGRTNDRNHAPLRSHLIQNISGIVTLTERLQVRHSLNECTFPRKLLINFLGCVLLIELSAVAVN